MPSDNCLEGLISQIVADPALHARWLNTFSYLEYVGFRKILKSQRAEVLTAAILTHACEEGRHALGLKKLAVKLGGDGFDSYAPQVLLCGEEADEASVYLATDSPGVVREEFAGMGELLPIDPPPGCHPFEVVLVLSRFDGLVIANSSFSWWAGFIGERPNRVVIAPRPWFTTRRRSAPSAVAWSRRES